MASNVEAIFRALKNLETQLNRIRRDSLSVSDLNVDPTIFLRGTFERFDTGTQQLCVRVEGEKLFYPLSYYESQWLPMPGQQVTITSSATGAPLRAKQEKSAGPDDLVVASGAVGSPLLRGFGRGGMSIPPAPTQLFTVKAYLYSQRQLKLVDSARSEIVVTLPENHRDYYDMAYKNGDPVQFRVIDVPPTQYFVPLTNPVSAVNQKARIIELLTGSA